MGIASTYEIGDRFGRWTIIDHADPIGKKRETRVKARCDCGSERVLRLFTIRLGYSRSCGCLAVEIAREHIIALNNDGVAVTHGQSDAPGYANWRTMIARCYSPKDVGYQYYGGRGITVCRQWLESVETFLLDVGAKPGAGYSIDRIDVNGNYEPGNVKWSTVAEQNRNKRSLRYIEYNGEVRCAAEWSRIYGICAGAIIHRLNTGKTGKDAIFSPTTRKGPTSPPDDAATIRES